MLARSLSQGLSALRHMWDLNPQPHDHWPNALITVPWYIPHQASQTIRGNCALFPHKYILWMIWKSQTNMQNKAGVTRVHTNDDILFTIVNFGVWPHTFGRLKKQRWKVPSSQSFFQKTIVVNLAENTCDRKTIMINVPIIQCRRCLLLSQLHRRRTTINLVVHIGHVWPQHYHDNFSNNPRSLLKKIL